MNAIVVSRTADVVNGKFIFMPAITYRKASAEDLAAIRRLLEEEHLPTADIDGKAQEFFVAAVDDKLVANIGLETYGDTALLRSMIVTSRQRNNGIASRMVSELISYAKAKHVRSLYIVTNTAEAYFEKKGFVKISREAVDSRLFASATFNGLCPASSVIMMKDLDN